MNDEGERQHEHEATGSNIDAARSARPSLYDTWPTSDDYTPQQREHLRFLVELVRNEETRTILQVLIDSHETVAHLSANAHLETSSPAVLADWLSERVDLLPLMGANHTTIEMALRAYPNDRKERIASVDGMVSLLLERDEYDEWQHLREIYHTLLIRMIEFWQAKS